MKQTSASRLFLQLQTAAAAQMEAVHLLLKQHGLTSPQYNVLRILRGAGQPLKCAEIAARMWTRDSDITRLLDRLEKRGLVERRRSAGDRRALEIGVTKAGLKLLSGLDQPVERLHQRQFSALSPAQREALSEALVRLSES